MRTKTFTTQIIILFLTSTFLFAQTNKVVKEKLNNVKGEVNKIVISSENGDVTFEGDEAKKLFKKMKSKTLHKNIEWISEDGEDFDSEEENVFIFESDDDKQIIKKLKGSDNIMIIHTDIDQDIELIDGAKRIEIEVEENDDEKTLTVTTTEDGKKKVEIFKGKEADDYLENIEDEHNMNIDIDIDMEIDSDKDYSTNKIWIHTDGNHNKIAEKIKVDVKDGEKIITITKTDNGEEIIEVLKGEEAENYLKENDKNADKVIIKKFKKDGGKVKKIIKKELKRIED